MEIFGQNPHKVIQDFSREFESSFLEHLRRCHPFSRIAANVVYNEFIQERDHVHMNSTRWLTLTEFVKYLGKEGKCKVEDTPKGWFITLIQKDPFEEMEKKKKRDREKHEKETDERHVRQLQVQAELARQERHENGDREQPEALDLNKLSEPVTISLKSNFNAPERPKSANKEQNKIEFEDFHSTSKVVLAGSKRSKVEELMHKELVAKKKTRKEIEEKRSVDEPQPWLVEHIIVKVMSPGLKEHGYYKKKARVNKVLDKFIGEVEMLDSGDVIRIDQDELETVVPVPGKTVFVLRGKYKGKKGKVESIDKANYGANIKIEGHDGSVFLEYEYFSKM